MTSPSSFTPEQLRQIAEIVESCRTPSRARRFLELIDRYRPFLSGFLSGLFFALMLMGVHLWIHRSASVPLLAEPAAIALAAPSDEPGRVILRFSCRNVSDLIRSETIASREEALTALSTETVVLCSDPAWKETLSRIHDYLSRSEDLSRWPDALHKIEEAFQ